MCQSTQTYYHDSEPTCLCSYFLIHLYCVLRAEETNTYFIVCFVPTEGSNLQSTALFPVLSQPRAQTYNLPHYSLFCPNRGLKPTIYRTIPCFVPTEGSNLQSTALFPLTPLMQLQTSVEI
jgi:hypothetical protein